MTVPSDDSELDFNYYSSRWDFNALCSWIVATCDPQADSVGLAICNEGELEEKLGTIIADALKPFGFKTAPFSECTVLLAVDMSVNPAMQAPLCGDSITALADFRKSKAKKMYFYCHPHGLQSNFIKTILDIDTNLLDISIFLPRKFFQDGTADQFALLVLDKNRMQDGRKDIKFIDATNLQPAKLKAAMASGETETVRTFFEGIFNGGYPNAEKDFREIVIREEPVLAYYHCVGQALQKVLKGRYKRLVNCAYIIKSPSYLTHLLRGQDTVELSCLSPRDFAAFGYTNPPSSTETKAFSTNRIRPEHYLKPKDILLVGQRNVGKLCIIDSAFFSEKAWTGASFTIIIRPKEPEDLDPRVLYMYLASEMVQQYLSACAGKSGLPMLPAHALKNLPVPVFSDAEKSDMVKAFDDLETARQLMAKVGELQRKFYSVD